MMFPIADGSEPGGSELGRTLDQGLSAMHIAWNGPSPDSIESRTAFTPEEIQK